jgi:hypothetical protein
MENKTKYRKTYGLNFILISPVAPVAQRVI